ncbi:MAG: DUF6171 family protein [Isosphaeraceae bacterium]
MSTSDPCPICGGTGCRTYPLMVERFTAGRDVEHWRRIHDSINGVETAAAYPSLLAQAGNLARAAAAFVADGLAVVGDEEQARRLELCRTCPQFDADQGRCRLCGCFMSLRARIQSSSCPATPPRW